MSTINESWNSAACCTTKPKNNGLFCDAAVTKPFNVREVAGCNNKNLRTPQIQEKKPKRSVEV